MRSVILLSGGLDSAVSLAMTTSHVFALTVDYGQRHSIELECAKELATAYHANHHVVTARMPFIDSPLTRDHSLKKRTIEEIQEDDRSPMIVPARNALLLSIGLCLAEEVGATELVISANSDDSGFPDCRKKFFAAFTAMAATCTESKPMVSTPLYEMTKAQVVEMAVALDVPIAQTCSCYRPLSRLQAGEVQHCGECDACVIRIEAFATARLEDPTVYYR